MNRLQDSARARAAATGALLLVLMLVSDRTCAQREERFWSEYNAAHIDPTGFRAKKQLVKVHRSRIHDAVSYQINSIANSLVAGNDDDAKNRLELLGDLTRMHELVHRVKVLRRRLEFARGLNAERAALLIQAGREWSAILGRKTKGAGDAENLNRIVQGGRRIVILLEKIGEDFLCGEVCEFVSRHLILKGDFAAAAESLARARRAFRRYKRTSREHHVALRIRRLERDHGQSLGTSGARRSGRDRPGNASRKTPTRFPPVRARYRKDKGPSKFQAPGIEHLHDHMLWRTLRLQRGKPHRWRLGDGSTLVWEGGNKLFLDLRNDGKRRIRLKAVAGSNNTMDIPVRYARGEGRYRLLLRALGTENFMGLELDYSSPDVLPIVFARSCHVEATFQGQKIILLDADLNGRYDDAGRDLVKVGRGLPTPLGRVIEIQGSLYSIARIKPDGSEIHFEEFVGDTGRIHTKWRGRVKPSYLVFRCVNGENSGTYVNVPPEKPVTVPTGTYEFARGIILQGRKHRVRFVQISTGRSKPFRVERSAEVEQAMGGPFDALCSLKKSKKGRMLLPGGSIRILGLNGEEYHHFYPSSFRPSVSIRAKGGAIVVKGKTLPRAGEELSYRYGMNARWHPVDLKFKGDHSRDYLIRVSFTHKLLGKVAGNWHEPTEPGSRR